MREGLKPSLRSPHTEPAVTRFVSCTASMARFLPATRCTSHTRFQSHLFSSVDWHGGTFPIANPAAQQVDVASGHAHERLNAQWTGAWMLRLVWLPRRLRFLASTASSCMRCKTSLAWSSMPRLHELRSQHGGGRTRCGFHHRVLGQAAFPAIRFRCGRHLRGAGAALCPTRNIEQRELQPLAC